MQALQSDDNTDLAPEVYIPLVDSLFRQSRVLVLGSIFVIGSVVLTFIKTGAVFLLLNAAALAVIAAIRVFYMHAYNRSRPDITTSDIARRWEYGYVAGASASVGLLGIWCFLSLAVTDDPFAPLISFAMTIGYVIGIFGRNFGSPKFVVVQIMCAWLPMTAALLIFGNVYHWCFAALLVPFFQSVKGISDRLRKTLLDAIVASHDISKLAQQFDTALTNMPQGICMFDHSGRVLVANTKTPQILGFGNDVDLTGWSVSRLVLRCMRAGVLPRGEARKIIEGFARKSTRFASEHIIESNDQLTLALTLQSMPDGGVVALIQDISERRQAEQTINHMAHYDSLTGLPNRHTFNLRLEQIFAQERVALRYAVHFIDLDHFKQVNDTLGHSRGDMLLQSVAERLQSILRDADMPARFGGDEFVVLQAHISSIGEAATLAKRIVAELERPYVIDGNEIMLSASVGIARPIIDGVDPEKVLKNADIALYNAKSSGRATFSFFEPEMHARAQARRNLELDLSNAIKNEELELHFQPIVELETGRIKSCEALLRWQHPERGFVSPGEFIPVAEETGAITEIGEFVVNQACQECCRWPDDVSVSVNISAVQFYRSDVAEIVSDALLQTGLSPNRLDIEITETALLQDTTDVCAALIKLQNIGVRVSLDDFGTGYSSLSYLHSLPLNKVKIDRSFIEGVTFETRSRTLLCGITRLSAELGLRVTVEGIETQEQLDLICKDNFIHEVQGFFFSRPLPADRIREALITLPVPGSRAHYAIELQSNQAELETAAH